MLCVCVCMCVNLALKLTNVFNKRLMSPAPLLFWFYTAYKCLSVLRIGAYIW